MQGHPIFNRLPARFRWTVHNVIAHPVSEVAFQLGMLRFSEWIHDVTAPTTEDPPAALVAKG